MAGERATVTQQDRTAAVALVADWTAGWLPGTHVSTHCQLRLVGMVTAALADARALERERLQDDAEDVERGRDREL